MLILWISIVNFQLCLRTSYPLHLFSLVLYLASMGMDQQFVNNMEIERKLQMYLSVLCISSYSVCIFTMAHQCIYIHDMLCYTLYTYSTIHIYMHTYTYTIYYIHYIYIHYTLNFYKTIIYTLITYIYICVFSTCIYIFYNVAPPFDG